MPYIEDFEKQQTEVAQAEALKTEPQGPILKELLANPEESRLLSLYLEHIPLGGTEDDIQLRTRLSARLLDGRLDQLDEKDMLDLADMRVEFLRKREAADKLKERLQKDLDRTLAATPDLKKISTNVGKEGIQKALIERVNDLIFTDPDRIEGMIKKYEEIEDAEKDIQWGNKWLGDIAKDHNLTEDEYSKALRERESNPYAFEDLIKEKTGWIGRLLISEDAMRVAVADLDQRDLIKERLQALNKNFGELGGALQKTLFENEKCRTLLTADLKGDAPPAKEVSFAPMHEVLRSYDFPAKQTEWNKYKSQHEKEKGFDVDKEYEGFVDRSTNAAIGKKKPGFWAKFASLILGNNLRTKVHK